MFEAKENQITPVSPGPTALSVWEKTKNEAKAVPFEFRSTSVLKHQHTCLLHTVQSPRLLDSGFTYTLGSDKFVGFCPNRENPDKP